MDNIPVEVLENIFYYLKDLNPISLYKLKFVSKSFNDIVINLKYSYNDQYLLNNINLQNKINRLCFKGNVDIFKWFFKNNIYLTDNNIINVVSNNRLDILNECIKYNKIINTIFNDKYSILVFNSKRTVKSESPLIMAGNKGFFDIMKFLIEISLFKNPFHQQLDILIEECLKKNDKTIIKYLCTYHYDKFINKYFTTEKVLKGLDKSQDLIFYLLLSNKICINNNFILECINKGYTDCCKYAYNKLDEQIIHGEHVKQLFIHNNLDLLDFFIKKYPYQFIYVRKYLSEITISKETFLHIFNNYLKFMDSDYPIIEIYLKYDQHIDTIKMLINNNYLITKKSIIKSLEIDIDKRIFKLLSAKY